MISQLTTIVQLYIYVLLSQSLEVEQRLNTRLREKQRVRENQSAKGLERGFSWERPGCLALYFLRGFSVQSFVDCGVFEGVLRVYLFLNSANRILLGESAGT